MHWFFFGSLLDPDVLHIVLDSPLQALHRQTALLPGFARYRVEQETFPAMAPHSESCVEGLLVSGLSEEDGRRICFFEGDEFVLQKHHVQTLDGATHEALVFRATELIALSSEPWSLNHWQQQHKPLYLQMSRDWMQAYGTAGYQELNQQWRHALGLKPVA